MHRSWCVRTHLSGPPPLSTIRTRMQNTYSDGSPLGAYVIYGWSLSWQWELIFVVRGCIATVQSFMYLVSYIWDSPHVSCLRYLRHPPCILSRIYETTPMYLVSYIWDSPHVSCLRYLRHPPCVLSHIFETAPMYLIIIFETVPMYLVYFVLFAVLSFVPVAGDARSQIVRTASNWNKSKALQWFYRHPIKKMSKCGSKASVRPCLVKWGYLMDFFRIVLIMSLTPPALPSFICSFFHASTRWS